MEIDLTQLLSAACAGDDVARFHLRDRLIDAMHEAVAGNAHVRRQLNRQGIHWSRSGSGSDSNLLDALSCSDLGARLVDQIGDIDLQPVIKVLRRFEQGEPAEEAIEKVARLTVLNIADREDSLVLVRKAIERGVRSARKAGEIEEIIAVGFRKSDAVDRNIQVAIQRRDPKSGKRDPLIGPPLRIETRQDAVVVYTASAGTSQKGEKLGILFRRPFIGPPGAVSEVVCNALHPWEELTRLRRTRQEIVELAKCNVKPLKPKRRKGRNTVRPVDSLPGAEVRRISSELAQVIGHPVNRQTFFAGLYATLSECGLETVARENDPASPFSKRREESHEMEIIDRIDQERAGRREKSRLTR